MISALYRQADTQLSVELPIVPKDKAIHVVVDSTGVAVLNRMIQLGKPDNYKVED